VQTETLCELHFRAAVKAAIALSRRVRGLDDVPLVRDGFIRRFGPDLPHALRTWAGSLQVGNADVCELCRYSAGLRPTGVRSAAGPIIVWGEALSA
jgi:hypothetical protein